MAATSNFRYLVKDENGLPLRQFYWEAEARRFLLPGWCVVRLPKSRRKPVIDWNDYDKAPF